MMKREQIQWLLQICTVALAILVTMSGCGWRPKLWTPNTEEREPNIVQNVVTYNIQLGLFDSQDEAEVIAVSARRQVSETVRVVYKPPFYRVWIETGLPEEEAEEFINRLREQGFSDARRIFKDDEY